MLNPSLCTYILRCNIGNDACPDLMVIPSDKLAYVTKLAWQNEQSMCNY